MNTFSIAQKLGPDKYDNYDFGDRMISEINAVLPPQTQLDPKLSTGDDFLRLMSYCDDSTREKVMRISTHYVDYQEFRESHFPKGFVVAYATGLLFLTGIMLFRYNQEASHNGYLPTDTAFVSFFKWAFKTLGLS